jgi:hypothetical protein
MEGIAKEPNTESLLDMIQRINNIDMNKEEPPEDIDIMKLEDLDKLILYLRRQNEYSYQVISMYQQLRELLAQIYKHNNREDLKEEEDLKIKLN